MRYVCEADCPNKVKICDPNYYEEIRAKGVGCCIFDKFFRDNFPTRSS